MADRLTCFVRFAFVFILCGAAAHVAGILTDFWFYGTSNNKDVVINKVNMGLWRQHIEYSNGTTIDSESPLNNMVEQYLYLAIMGSNVLLCMIVMIKAIHVCVGVLAFIIMSLMVLSVCLIFDNAHARMVKLQQFRPEWPVMRLWWSFFLVFGGLLLNILSTVVFLISVLLKGEKQAANTYKGLEPSEHVVNVSDKTPIITISSRDNYSYDNNGVTAETNDGASFSGYASPDTNYIDVEHEYDTIDTYYKEIPKQQTPKESYPAENFHEIDIISTEMNLDYSNQGKSMSHYDSTRDQEIRNMASIQDVEIETVTESVTKL